MNQKIGLISSANFTCSWYIQHGYTTIKQNWTNDSVILVYVLFNY